MLYIKPTTVTTLQTHHCHLYYSYQGC